MRKPNVHSMGVSKDTDPPHMVPIQLKNFTPVGTAMRNVMPEKKSRSTAPVTNMWCAHTAIDSMRDQQRGARPARCSRRSACG